MADGDLRDEILAALGKDRTIDIFTTGARTGKPRTTKIWFTRVEGVHHLLRDTGRGR